MPDPPPDPPPILNTCLAYMKFLMRSRDRLYIQDAMCARFKLSEIQNAHRVISLHCDPGETYNKRGPNKGPREKAIYFFEESFKILQNLDKDGLSPNIACPAEELGVILNLNGPCDHKMIEVRFQTLEEQVSKISKLESAFADLSKTVSSMNASSSYQSVLPSSIPQGTKERISKQSSKLTAANPELQSKPRSDSIGSLKRFRITSEDESEKELEFELEKISRRKEMKKRKTQAENTSGKSYPKSNAQNSAFPLRNTRREANWGTASSVKRSPVEPTEDKFPDLFISNCRDRPEESDIKTYLIAKGVTVLGIKKMSPGDAVKRSFRVTVGSLTDYKNVIKGGWYLPRGVAVKDFMPSSSSAYKSQWVAPSGDNAEQYQQHTVSNIQNTLTSSSAGAPAFSIGASASVSSALNFQIGGPLSHVEHTATSCPPQSHISGSGSAAAAPLNQGL